MKSSNRQMIRRNLARMFGWRCALCGVDLVEPKPSTDVFRDEPPEGTRWATLDHILPKRHGGRDVMHNLQLACPPCNSDKADRIG